MNILAELERLAGAAIRKPEQTYEDHHFAGNALLAVIDPQTMLALLAVVRAAPGALEALQEVKQLLDMVLCVSGGLPPEADGPAVKALASISALRSALNGLAALDGKGESSHG